MRLKRKVAFVTGGGGEIATTIAQRFLENGASVVLFDIDGAQLKKVSDTFTSDKQHLATLIGDVRKLDEVEKAVAETEKRFGGIDILVNCAGVLKHLPIDELAVADWDRVIGINLTGTYITCKAVVPGMKARKAGHIINISSLGGRTGRPGVADYAASKAGVIGIAQTLARELGAFNITVNSIAPGPLAGQMTSQIPPEKLKILLNNARASPPGDDGRHCLRGGVPGQRRGRLDHRRSSRCERGIFIYSTTPEGLPGDVPEECLPFPYGKIRALTEPAAFPGEFRNMPKARKPRDGAVTNKNRNALIHSIFLLHWNSQILF